MNEPERELLDNGREPIKLFDKKISREVSP